MEATWRACETQIVGPPSKFLIPQVQGGAREHAFLTRVRVLLVLLVLTKQTKCLLFGTFVGKKG